MHDAAVHNSRYAPECHSTSSRRTLHEVSKNLQACQIMLATIPKTDNGHKILSTGISIMLEYVSESLGQYADEIRKLACENPGQARLAPDERVDEQLRHGPPPGQVRKS